MLTVKPAQDNPLVLAFDGCVLEVFRVNGSSRVHVALLDKIELKTDKKGAHTIAINAVGSYTIAAFVVDEQGYPTVARLIEEVQKAKSQFVMD